MKINGKRPGVNTENCVGRVADPSPRKAEEKPVPFGDSVDISSRARELSRLKKMLESTPEVRTDLVVRLRTEIENGGYGVDAAKVAEKMIERALRNILNSRK